MSAYIDSIGSLQSRRARYVTYIDSIGGLQCRCARYVTYIDSIGGLQCRCARYVTYIDSIGGLQCRHARDVTAQTVRVDNTVFAANLQFKPVELIYTLLGHLFGTYPLPVWTLWYNPKYSTGITIVILWLTFLLIPILLNLDNQFIFYSILYLFVHNFLC